MWSKRLLKRLQRAESSGDACSEYEAAQLFRHKLEEIPLLEGRERHENPVAYEMSLRTELGWRVNAANFPRVSRLSE